MSSDVLARLAAAKENTYQKQAETATEVAAETFGTTFEVTESEIQSNPVYQIITDENLTDQERLERLQELKSYNEELTAEQNELNREASNQFLLYVENQLMASTQKGIAFTNDNAFALYDDTVRELFDNVKVFKGYIEPFVQALRVLQKARDSGVPANELIDAVSKMQSDLADLEAEKSIKVGNLDDFKTDLADLSEKAEHAAFKLDSITRAIEKATADKAKAESSWNVLSRGKAIKAAQDQIDQAQSRSSILQNTSQVLSDNVQNTQDSIAKLEDSIRSLDEQIQEATAKIDGNEDSQAIATLIEITGEDFKDKREEVVSAAQSITEKAIEGIEKSIGRFQSGSNETGTQLNTVVNLNGMVSLISAADSKVRVADANFISEQKEIVDRIEKEKAEDAIYDPDYEQAKKHLERAHTHVADVIASSERAMDLNGKLTRQTGTFKGLRDAYDQKKYDATRLRTSAAVEIPSQLAVTVKSVEMATATESNNMVNDAFADLSRTTQESVSSIFETVSAGAGQNNKQLRDTLEQTMSTIEMMNAVEKDLREKAREGAEARKDLKLTQDALRTITEVVATVATDADNNVITGNPSASAPVTPGM